MPGVLVWDHAIHDIPEAGLTVEQQAAPDELARVAEALELIACTHLSAAYTIIPTGSGRYRLSGSLAASLEQACVVTLEPVAAQITETFDVTFWPQSDILPAASGEVDLDEEPDPEPIAAGNIEAGRIVFEGLAAAIDPYPRKPDAALDRVSAGPAGAEAAKPESPFAVLARIKEKG